MNLQTPAILAIAILLMAAATAAQANRGEVERNKLILACLHAATSASESMNRPQAFQLDSHIHRLETGLAVHSRTS